MHTSRPYCLSIAGFDPCGGAGIMADTKVFECLQTNGLGIVSALTYQNDSEFEGVNWCSFSEIEKQLYPLRKYPVKAAKIGLIKDFEQLMKTSSLLKSMFPEIFVVWDPILKASAGFSFHDNTSLADEVLCNIDLITPNFEEFTQLGMAENLDLNCAVLLKGGHRTDKLGIDCLHYYGKIFDIEGAFIANKKDKHGTGCVLSAAIVAHISKAESVYNACKKSKSYVETFIQSNDTKLGYHL
jgi:hydroxymethylpyrimidine/phosphomethylpyrimidine kinase